MVNIVVPSRHSLVTGGEHGPCNESVVVVIGKGGARLT